MLQIGLPCDHRWCENLHKMWNWALDSSPWKQIVGFLQKYLDSWKKKHISNLTAKMVCKNSNSPLLPLDTRRLLIYIWARTTLLLPVWINEHHTLGKLLLSRQNKLSTHHNSLHWHIQHIGTAQQLKIFQTCRIDNLSSWKYFPIQWYAEQSSPLTPQNIIFMIFKSQMSILCVKTRDMLAVGQGCDQKAGKSWKMFSLFPLTRNSQLL